MSTFFKASRGTIHDSLNKYSLFTIRAFLHKERGQILMRELSPSVNVLIYYGRFCQVCRFDPNFRPIREGGLRTLAGDGCLPTLLTYNHFMPVFAITSLHTVIIFILLVIYVTLLFDVLHEKFGLNQLCL